MCIRKKLYIFFFFSLSSHFFPNCANSVLYSFFKEILYVCYSIVLIEYYFDVACITCLFIILLCLCLCLCFMLILSYGTNWGENLEQMYLFFCSFDAHFSFLFTNLITIRQFVPKIIPLCNKLTQLTRK